MRIIIKTEVDASVSRVAEQFTEELFIALSPKFPKISLKRFDGSRKGDIVSLELNFFIFKQAWTSEITDDYSGEGRWFFIDEGTEVPFFLKQWKHKHLVEQVGKDKAQIVDDIQFSSGWKIIDLCLYPVFKAQFLARQPIYKKYFKEKV